MYKSFYRKATSLVTTIAMLFSFFSPLLLDSAFATIDTVGNSVSGGNTGYINLSNSGAYPVFFTFSGSLDAGDIVNLDLIDGSSATVSTGFTAAGSETGVTLYINTVSLSDGSITLSGSVYSSGLTEVATGITSVGAKDIVIPGATIVSTGAVTTSNSGIYTINGTGSENLKNLTINFSGSTTASATVFTGGTTFSGVVDLSSFDDGTISYSVTPIDLAGNSGNAVTGNILKHTVLGGSISTSSGSFVVLTGSLNLSGLDIGGVYGIYSGSTLVSSGMLTADNSTGSIYLNPSYFLDFGQRILTLSGTDVSFGLSNSNLDSKTFFLGPVNYETLFTSIGDTLTSSGIINNLSGVTNINVSDYSSLYFEKTGYGKILFNSGMDLTNTGTQAFLQSLPAKLDMTDGYINFDTAGSAFANYGAQLFMYFTGSSVPDFSGSTLDYITARDGSGVIIPDALSGSTLLCAIGVGIPYQVCTFANNHFTSFDFNPYLTVVAINSNNAYSGSLAKVGDVVSLSFSGIEALTGITVTFNGIAAAQIQGGGDSWVAISEPINSGSTTGLMSFSIDYSDISSNTGVTITGTLDNSSVTIDKTSPTASVVYSTTGAINGDVIATLTGASESITGTLTYTFTGNTSYTFNYRDNAGNTGSNVATVTWINKDMPVITLNGSGTINIEFGSDYTELGATWSDSIDGTGVVSVISGTVNTGSIGTYSLQYIYVNSLINTGTTTRTVNVVDTGIPTATVEYSPATLTGGNVVATLTGASESITGTLTHTFTGNTSYTFVFHDLSGNTGSTVATVTWIDKTSPVISGRTVNNITQTGSSITFNFSESNFSSGTGYVIVYTGGSVSNLVETGSLNLTFTGSNGSGSATFLNLTGSTNYNYLINLIDDVNNTSSSTGTFTTATTPIALTGGTSTQTGSVTLTGGTMSTGSTLDLSGTTLTISSDPNDSSFITGSLSISGTNITITGSTSWNGILIPPTVIDNTTTDSATGSEIGTGITVTQTIRVGAEGASLVPSTSTGYFNVSFTVPGYASGTVLDLYRSNDGLTWTRVTPDGSCTLDANSLCSFRTDHLTLFAPVVDSTPDAFSFSAVTGAELSTDYTNITTVAGINTGSTISISGGLYKIGAGSYTGSTGTVNNGDVVTVKLTSSSSYSTATSMTLTVGGVSASYSVTTKAQSTGGGSSGGGGGGGASRDVCPNGDYSSSYYDGQCGVIPTLTGSTNNGTTTTAVTTTTTSTTTNSNTNSSSNNQTNSNTIRFHDTDKSFAKDDIVNLVNKGVIKGYSDGTFRPENSSSRGEFLAMVFKALNISVNEKATTNFTDIPTESSWMIKYIVKAKELGIVNGQMINGKLIFRPNDPVTRAEAMAILLNTAKIAVDPKATTNFTDIPEWGRWMIKYIEKARELGIAKGQLINGKLVFRPGDPITRAETARVIMKTLGLVK